MSEVVISVENLGKRYRIQHRQQRQRYVALRDVLADHTKSLARRLWSAIRRPLASDLRPLSSGPPSQEDFWALRNVSFEIKQGESVGIIGRNGAGKSTLLKILSRITEPTTGRIRIRGRVASLLEVGTGFHAELTGRENIFLNGAVLGMTRVEIRRKFDEIVAFAEIDKFLDTPVKRYSSGMYVRLAFSVAAHLEPEILIVDEVLAVGDAAFQKKCLGRMGEVARSGRTVLFVSHNMGMVAELCSRALSLDKGRACEIGGTQEVVSHYLQNHTRREPKWVRPHDTQAPRLSLQAAQILSEKGEAIRMVDFREAFRVEIIYDIYQPIQGGTVSFRITNADSVTVVVSSERDSTNLENEFRKVGRYRAICCMPGKLLRNGLYYLNIGAYIENREVLDQQQNVLAFEVSVVGCPAMDGRPGVISPILVWDVEFGEHSHEGGKTNSPKPASLTP